VQCLIAIKNLDAVGTGGQVEIHRAAGIDGLTDVAIQNDGQTGRGSAIPGDLDYQLIRSLD